eukprot:s40_g37.t2
MARRAGLGASLDHWDQRLSQRVFRLNLPKWLVLLLNCLQATMLVLRRSLDGAGPAVPTVHDETMTGEENGEEEDQESDPVIVQWIHSIITQGLNRNLIRLGSHIPPPEDDDEISFPELPAHKHWLVKDPEFGLVCKRCQHKGPFQFFKTFLCVGDPPPKPATTPKAPVEAENAPATDSGHASAASSPGGMQQDAAVDSAARVLEKGKGLEDALEVERLELEWLQQQLDELEMDKLEKEYLELAMQESMMEHELEMADKVDYGDEKKFNPCAKMRGVPQIVGVGAFDDVQEQFEEVEYEFEEDSEEEQPPKEENPENKENKDCPHQDTRRPPASPCTSKRLPPAVPTPSLLAA